MFKGIIAEFRDRIIAEFMVSNAMKRQPQGYITLIYSPAYGYEMNTSNLQSISKTWIRSVLMGNTKSFAAWEYLEKSEQHVLKGIALNSDDLEARQHAIRTLLFYRGQTPRLWRWKMKFLPKELH